MNDNCNREKIAIIGGIGRACIYAKFAKEMGIETHCFDWNENAVARDYVDFFYPISILDKNKILLKCQEIGVSGIVSTTELAMGTVAYVASKMHLNGNSVNVAEKIANKYRNRNSTLNVVGLSHPKYIETSTLEKIINSDLEYPIILKPTDKAGKKGVCVSYSKEETQKAFEYAVDEVGMNSKFIVEEFIDGGIECSVESLSFHNKHHIIQITEKISSGAPHCVELGHIQPARVSESMKDRIKQVIMESLTAVGIENGPCHTEIKIKDEKIYLIEFNARTGGDHIAYPLTHLSTGFEYIKGCINVALDKDPCIDESRLLNYYSGVHFVTEQTQNLVKLFDVCQNYDWCYDKHISSDNLCNLTHNDGMHTNYFIYFSKNARPDIENLSERLNNSK